MGVAIRLARFGCRNRPFYRLMAADSRCQRDGKHLEVLGFYDPLSGEDGDKRMGLKFDRVMYWLSVGAQPSEPVERILIKAGILPPPPMLAVTPKGGPRGSPLINAMSDRLATSESTEDADHPMPPASLPLSLSVPVPGAMDSAL